MAVFGWLAPCPEPPALWDLRQIGWNLCHGHSRWRAECRHVLLCDARQLPQAMRIAMAEADRPAWRLIMLGVETPSERADLIAVGCAEALSGTIGLRELAARARRVDTMFGLLPRWRNVGPLTLDLFHRDARRGQRWLHLHPREFGVLWRLADAPGQRVTRRQLLDDVWRISHDPETNSVEVHISRLRSKLALAQCAHLLETVPEGGYRLLCAGSLMFTEDPAEGDRLDRYLLEIGWMHVPAQ